MFLTRKDIERLERREGDLRDPKHRMDYFYREQRHSYDWSRRFYLWGRDTLLRKIDVPEGSRILEVGCGTARNLIQLARHCPSYRLYGLDASSLMLETAGEKVRYLNLEKRVTVQLGVAESWTFRDFNLEEPLEAVIFSYSLSMIDDWKGAVEVACRNLRPGGKVYAVDFGDQGGMPFWYRRLCNLWFDHFAFKRLYEMPDFFRHLTETKRGQVQVLSIGWGHANAVTFTLPSGPGDPSQIPR